MQNNLWMIPLGVLLSFTAVADEQSVIDSCKQTASDAERIACLEAAIREMTGAAAIEPQVEIEADVSVDSEPSHSVAETLSADAGPVDYGTDPVEGENEPPATVEVAAAEPEEQQAVGAEATMASNASVDEVEESIADIGEEQVEARTRTRDEHIAGLQEARDLVVDRFEYVGYRKLQVRLQNGQIWRQIKGDVQEIRVNVGRNPTVDISESPIGGYRLRLNEIRRTIRVRRIR